MQHGWNGGGVGGKCSSFVHVTKANEGVGDDVVNVGCIVWLEQIIKYPGQLLWDIISMESYDFIVAINSTSQFTSGSASVMYICMEIANMEMEVSVSGEI